MKNSKLFICSMVLALGAWIGAGAQTTQQSSTSAAQTAPSRNSLVVPTGTQVSVRTNEAINSSNATQGQQFSAEVADDVKGNNGEILIPKGSPAELSIENISSGGTTGSAELALALHSVSINGRRYLVSSENLNQSSNQGIGKNKRTGEMVGGGAALGTLLGAIAGGGKGAVIGAVAGAAAGGATQVLTRGKEVKVPAETVLNFQLQKPLQLNATAY